jgi:hypothetical protein
MQGSDIEFGVRSLRRGVANGPSWEKPGFTAGFPIGGDGEEQAVVDQKLITVILEY